MYYEDLLTVPFKVGGRDKNGMDCYGLVIELTRRNGRELRDLLATHVTNEQAAQMAYELNVMQITERDAKSGDIVECLWNGETHIAFMLDKKCVIHATINGVRVSPINSLINRKYYRVV